MDRDSSKQTPRTGVTATQSQEANMSDCHFIKQLKEMLQEMGAETKLGKNIEVLVKRQGRGMLLILAASDWKSVCVVDAEILEDACANMDDKQERVVDPKLDEIFDAVTKHWLDRKQVPEVNDPAEYPSNDAFVNHIRLKHVP